MKKIPSYKNGVDCFGNKGTSTKDHIYPKGIKMTNGWKVAKAKINRQLLTGESNNAKGSKLKGIINGWEFVIIKNTTKLKDKIVYGRMRIRKKGNKEWITILPI